MEFPIAQEMPDGTQAWLLKLRDSKLQDEILLEEFYEKIIKNYAYGENYYIILIHASYDIPKKAEDRAWRCSCFRDVYEYLCAVSARSSWTRQVSATMLRKIILKTGNAAGSYRHRMPAFCSLHSMTATPIFTACSTIPATRRYCSLL